MNLLLQNRDRENVFLLNYDSLDDSSTFEDFADKLDEDYQKLFHGERIDVACHSTGALVSRAWLRAERGGDHHHWRRRLGRRGRESWSS